MIKSANIPAVHGDLTGGAFCVRCEVPIYEYECDQCSTRFERRQRFDEEPVAACPQCAGKARRVIHSVPVLFKGSGFYCTDNGRVVKGSRAPSDDDAKPATETQTEAKTQTKSEVKAEAAAEVGD